MVYWYDDVAHYSKGFQGFVVTMGWTMGIVGVAAYTSVFKKFSFRSFLCGLQLFQAALSTLDWFLVVYAGDVSGGGGGGVFVNCLQSIFRRFVRGWKK